MRHTRMVRMAIATTLALAASSVAADPARSTGSQMAQLAGHMHAAAETCGDYTADQLERMHQEQRTATIQMSLPAAQYDSTFQAAYRSGKDKIAKSTPGERTKICGQLRAMNRGR